VAGNHNFFANGILVHNCIVVDDPNDAREANSKAARDQISYWWDNAAANRLADLRTGVRCIIQQRLHEEDLTGHVLANEPGEWEVLIIREEFEQPKPSDPDFLPTSLGWKDPRTVEGELFFATRFPAEVVNAERKRLGSAGYAGQHQQRPAPAEGQIFKKGYVRTFCMEDTLRKLAERNPKGQPVWQYKRIILSADTAFKEKEENDFSVCLAVGERAEGFDLLDRWKDKAGYPELKLRVKAMNAQWHPQAFLIEDKASGQSLIQELRLESAIPIVPIKVDRDKVSRAHSVVPTWEAGNVFVDPSLPWVADFLDQLYGFPKLAHDDDVDAFTQAMNYLHHGFEGQGVFDYYKQQAEKMAAGQG
jgi:predicted phage terminase large subunit-like protein